MVQRGVWDSLLPLHTQNSPEAALIQAGKYFPKTGCTNLPQIWMLAQRKGLEPQNVLRETLSCGL